MRSCCRLSVLAGAFILAERTVLDSQSTIAEGSSNLQPDIESCVESCRNATGCTGAGLLPMLQILFETQPDPSQPTPTVLQPTPQSSTTAPRASLASASWTPRRGRCCRPAPASCSENRSPHPATL